MIKSKKIKKKHLRKRSASVLDEEENTEETRYIYFTIICKIISVNS